MYHAHPERRESMPLDPWIIEEILKREREEREKRDPAQIDLPLEEPGEDPENPGGTPELPVDRKPGYEKENPSDPARPSTEKKEEDRRGVDISRITGNDDDEDDEGSVRKIDIPGPPKPLPKDQPKKKPD